VLEMRPTATSTIVEKRRSMLGADVDVGWRETIAE
jgi:hypothetical protein